MLMPSGLGATYIGPALSDTINQAAPTICMNLPTSERKSASTRLRKVGERNGRHTLKARSIGACGCAGMSLAKVAWSARLASIKLPR